MGKTIKFRTVATSGRFGGGASSCHGQIIHNEALGIDGMAEGFALMAGIGVHEARMYVSLFADYITSALGEGKHLNFGNFEMFLAMNGRIDGLNGKFDAAKNSITVNFRIRKKLKAALAQLEPVNVADEGKHVTITSVMDSRHKEEGVLGAGDVGLAIGGTFLIDAERDDEGVWLERDDGERVARAKVRNSTATTLDFVFEEPPPPGAYRLAVYTRMGDPSFPVPAHTRRKITIL